jgi:hypothetical protein
VLGGLPARICGDRREEYDGPEAEHHLYLAEEVQGFCPDTRRRPASLRAGVVVLAML